MPAVLARGSVAGEVPRRSLAAVAVLSLLALGGVEAANVGAAPLVLLTTGSFVMVYALGVGAAVKLLPRRSAAWASALVALAAVAVLLVMSGQYLFWPLLVGAGALAYGKYGPGAPKGTEAP